MKAPHDLSRREFLAHSANLAGASLGPLAARKAAAEGAPAQIRVGLIGLGDRGRHLLKIALDLTNVRVAGLCDVHPGRLKRALDLARGHGPRGYTDYRALLEARDVDAVLIATPVYQHALQTVDSLAAKKHVYCEKPMALTARDCRAVYDACRRAEERGQVYQIGLQRRYSPAYRESIRFLHGGEAGPVRFVRAQWHAVGSARKDKPWFFRRDKSGDIMLEQACHQFDVFNWIFQSTPRHASGMGGAHGFRDGPPGRDILDHYCITLEYPGGAKVQLTHLTYSIPEKRFAGIYELVFCEKTGVDLARALTWTASGETRHLCKSSGGESRRALADFFDAISSGRQPDAGAEVGRDATMVALLCQRAVETGRLVSFDELDSI
jgi:predicted dehydrogenase